MRCLIIGGGGYVGHNLCCRLLQLNHHVTLADVQFSDEVQATASEHGVKLHEVDITDADSLAPAFNDANVDCVFHVASYGMSGSEMLHTQKIESVNVNGTRNVIEACKQHSVQSLVYTSTYNVVFGGQTIINGDETLPYLPLDQHVDAYSRTKSIAEQLVLKANCPNQLHTCALRLAGVYGPGEQRHLPRAVSYMSRGLYCATFGLRQATVDFLHIDNLVQAHVKAAQCLMQQQQQQQQQVAGQAFFISDSAPVENFKFFEPLATGLGYSPPTLVLPYHFVYAAAFVCELLAPRLQLQPLLTRAEVCKTGVTHYFSTELARQRLHYAPTVQNDLTECVSWFRQRGYAAARRQRSAAGSGWAAFVLQLLGAVCVAVLIMALLPLAS